MSRGKDCRYAADWFGRNNGKKEHGRKQMRPMAPVLSFGAKSGHTTRRNGRPQPGWYDVADGGMAEQIEDRENGKIGENRF
ncbi:MAG: hypothetical protein HZA50_17020 [Planctomycetes bacterium]|nr:hypothetical protein [Planctomycetota bacterium]